MDKKKANVPKIRFPGFTGEWERRKAGDIFFTVSDKNHPELSVLSASQEFGMIKREESGIYISHKKENEIGYKRVLPGQFVIHLRSFQSGFAHSIIEGITSPAYTVMDFKNTNNHYHFFWKYIFNSKSFIKRLELITYGIRDGRSISYNDFATLSFNFPKYQEQKKIGLLFENLDKLITLHQRKLNHLQVKKNGLLQKMFPQEGEDVPKLRFPGFTDAWEQHRLGDLGSVAMNRRIFKEETSENGEVPFYKIGTFGNKPDAFISRKLFEEYKSKYPYPEIGDILISASGSIGRTVQYMGEDEYFQDSNIVWLKHDERLVNSFLKQFYFVVMWNGLEGSTIKRLYNKNILETLISLPNVEEQKKVGQFFSRLDNLITLHQRKLTHLQEQKKALLQQMFV